MLVCRNPFYQLAGESFQTLKKGLYGFLAGQCHDDPQDIECVISSNVLSIRQSPSEMSLPALSINERRGLPNGVLGCPEYIHSCASSKRASAAWFPRADRMKTISIPGPCPDDPMKRSTE